jgi:hypothetical protein
MKIKSALPKGDSNGISPLEPRIIKKSNPVVALVVLDEAGRYQDHETLEWEVTLRIRRIEALLAEDVEAATRLLQRAYESRTGESTLPLELENDIRDALKGVDLYVPETQQAEPMAVPDGGYSAMKVPELLALLKGRGLDHSKGTKTELIGRLEGADALADSGEIERPSNVTSIFSDGSDYQPSDADAPPADDSEWEDADPANATPPEEIPEEPGYSIDPEDADDREEA